MAGVDDDAFAAVAERAVPGSVLVDHRPLAGGVSASVHELRLRTADRETRSVVVRRHGAHAWKTPRDGVTATEFALLRSLRSLGLPVPEVLALDESGEILPTPYFVMERVAGTSAVAGDTLPDALSQMAAFLATLHDLDPDHASLPSLPDLEDPREGALTHLPRTPDYDALRRDLDAARLPAPPPSLLHCDLWPGNVLWRDGRLAAVIDWEDASRGDAMADVATARVELMCAHGEAAVHTFTTAYAAARPLDATRIALWEIYAASAALATMSQWGLAPQAEQARRDGTERALALAVETWSRGRTR